MLNFMVKCSATVTPCVNYSTCNEICSFPACHPEGGLRSTFHVCSSGDELIWSCITKFGRWATVHKKRLPEKKKKKATSAEARCKKIVMQRRRCKDHAKASERWLVRATSPSPPRQQQSCAGTHSPGTTVEPPEAAAHDSTHEDPVRSVRRSEKIREPWISQYHAQGHAPKRTVVSPPGLRRELSSLRNPSTYGMSWQKCDN